MERTDTHQESWIGPGISYRRRYHHELISLAAQGTETASGKLVLEIIPEHFFAHPAALEILAEKYCLVFHDLGLSIATVRIDEARHRRLQHLNALVRLAKPVLFSDHLALTGSPAGLDCGHLAPAWYTDEALYHTVEHVRRCQDVLGIPIAFENIAAPFILPAPMSEPEFMTRLVERTGCGLLLDIGNLLCNARNFRYNACDWLTQYPLEAVQQVHLAGGTCHNGWWVDSHSEPVEDASFALLQGLAHCTALKTIVIERDRNLPSLTALVAEAQHAAQLWRRCRYWVLP